MKKNLTTLFFLAGATTVFSQGLVNIAEYTGSFYCQIMNVQTTPPINGTAYTSTYNGYTSGVQYYGNTTNPGGNIGTTVYGTTTGITSGFDVQLLAAPGLNDSLSTLSTVGPIVSTWYVYPPGNLNPAVGVTSYYEAAPGLASLATIPTPHPNGPVTVTLAVWDNENGTVNSLLTAQQADVPWGIAPVLANISLTGGGAVSPPQIPNIIPDFSVGQALVPEPSTMALGFLGAFTLYFRRRT
jgi:hypothetical protein